MNGSEPAIEDLIPKVQARWPRCKKLLRAAMDKMHAELMKDGLDDDAAFDLVQVAMLHEIFFIQTVVAVREALPDDVPPDDAVMDWIRTEYDDWQAAE